MKITAETIAQLKEARPGIDLYLLKHPEIDATEDVGAESGVVVRPPTDAEWRRFREKALSDEAREQLNGIRELVTTCVVYPSGTQLQELISAHPALVEVWAGEISQITGSTKAMIRRKL